MIYFKLCDRVAEIVLARPAAANALSGEMIRCFTDVIGQISVSSARVVRLSGEGDNFCAGADVNWMRESAKKSSEENRRESLLFANLLYDIYTLPQPVIAVVHGGCYGGGIGLAAVADICLSGRSARFCFGEVKLGLIPATISPYVIAAIGERQARRYFLDASVFSADDAMRLGLAHEVVADTDLFTAANRQISRLLNGGATAQAMIKKLLPNIIGKPPGLELSEKTAHWLAESRTTDEAREGIEAFLQKRSPHWRKPYAQSDDT